MICPTYKFSWLEIEYTFAQSVLKNFERDESNVAFGVKLTFPFKIEHLKQVWTSSHAPMSPRASLWVCTLLSEIVLFA